jgi:hypothetical protein
MNVSYKIYLCVRIMNISYLKLSHYFLDDLRLKNKNEMKNIIYITILQLPKNVAIQLYSMLLWNGHAFGLE